MPDIAKNRLAAYLVFILCFMAVLLSTSCSESVDCIEIPGADADRHDVDGDELSDGDLADGDEDPVEGDGESEAQPRPSISDDLVPEDLILDPSPASDFPQLPDGIALRVMSYNIYGGSFATAEEIGRMIATHDIDIVGLQECPEDYVQPMADAGGFEYYAGSGVAMLSKTPLENFRATSLTVGRSYVYAETEISGVRFSVYCAHLGWNVDGDKQFRELVDEHLAHETNKYFVMMGDFNDEHYSSQISIMEEFAKDAATEFGMYPGERISWPSTGFDDTEGSQLIDLVWFRKDFEAIVIDSDIINMTPVLSDHKPAIAELLYPPSIDEPFESNPFDELRNPRKGFPSPESMPDNLLSNPGAESGLESWEITGDAMSVSDRQQQSAFAGENFFTGWEGTGDRESELSTGRQLIDLGQWADIIDEGRGRLLVSAMMTTGFQTVEADGIVSNKPLPYDEGEILVEALGATQSHLLSVGSKRRDCLGWHPYYDFLDLPPESRFVSFSWISHHKSQNGPGNDAAFDELYLGFVERDETNSLLGGSLLANHSAEDGLTEDWEADGWIVLDDGEIHGMSFFPPRSFAGGKLFYGGGPLDLEGGNPGLSTLSQKVSLEDHYASIDDGIFALRWGGWLRTWTANSEVAVSLEIFDEDGLWGIIEGPSVFAAEWTDTQALTRIPPGATAVRMSLSADVELVGSGVFADELYLVPEVVQQEE